MGYIYPMIKGFSLSYSKGSAWLTVFPRQDGERTVYSDEIKARMKILGIPPVRASILEMILRDASGMAVELGPWPGGEILSSRCRVTISRDEMTASLSADPPRPGGEGLTETHIRTALKEAGVSRGIDEARIGEMVRAGIYNSPVVLATGLPPSHGKGPRVKYHFVTNHVPYRELLYGRIDLRELNYIQNRKQGDLLAELVPREEPRDGYTVTGKILPAEQADKGEALAGGDGTVLKEGKLLAARDGNARLEKGLVIVEPVVVVRNVDYETGNLDFDGSVIVKGTVADGFSVIASGDLEIEKCVGRVTLRAGRNILLKQGINGDQGAEVRAGGTLTAKYGEGSRLCTGGDLIIREALMHCALMVKGNLLLSGGRAELLGGTAVVRGSLLCRKLGGIYEPATSVYIGIDPDDLEAYRNLLTSLEVKRGHLDELDRKIGLLRKGGDMDRDRKDMVLQAEKQLEEEAGLLNGEIQDLVTRSHEMGRTIPIRRESLLIAEDRIYGGVHISFGFLEYTGNAGGKGVPSTILRRQEGAILDKGFNPGDMPEISEL